MIIPFERKDPIMRVSGVSLSLGGRQVLRDVELEIRNLVRSDVTQGQVVGLLGPSGMGKTQLFRILSALIQPDSGTVLAGAPLRPVQAGQVGVVAQDYPLFSHRTVMSNMILAGRMAGKSADEAASEAMRLLARFGLPDEGEKYPVQLSGGQKQRVAIAQQLMCSDMFMLLDEPFSGLDPLAVDALCTLITEVSTSDELKTLIIVTHDISAALRVCDSLLLLGRDRDDAGKAIPGARVQQVIDLAEQGLAWQPELRHTPAFFEAEAEVHARFALL